MDYTYVLFSAFLCEKFNIPHFSLVSTVGACSTSMFYYFEVKGKAEEALKNLHKQNKIETLSIFQPDKLNRAIFDFDSIENSSAFTE